MDSNSDIDSDINDNFDNNEELEQYGGARNRDMEANLRRYVASIYTYDATGRENSINFAKDNIAPGNIDFNTFNKFFRPPKADANLMALAVDDKYKHGYSNDLLPGILDQIDKDEIRELFFSTGYGENGGIENKKIKAINSNLDEILLKYDDLQNQPSNHAGARHPTGAALETLKTNITEYYQGNETLNFVARATGGTPLTNITHKFDIKNDLLFRFTKNHDLPSERSTLLFSEMNPGNLELLNFVIMNEPELATKIKETIDKAAMEAANTIAASAAAQPMLSSYIIIKNGRRRINTTDITMQDKPVPKEEGVTQIRELTESGTFSDKKDFFLDAYIKFKFLINFLLDPSYNSKRSITNIFNNYDTILKDLIDKFDNLFSSVDTVNELRMIDKEFNIVGFDNINNKMLITRTTVDQLKAAGVGETVTRTPSDDANLRETNGFYNLFTKSETQGFDAAYDNCITPPTAAAAAADAAPAPPPDNSIFRLLLSKKGFSHKELNEIFDETFGDQLKFKKAKASPTLNIFIIIYCAFIIKSEFYRSHVKFGEDKINSSHVKALNKILKDYQNFETTNVAGLLRLMDDSSVAFGGDDDIIRAHEVSNDKEKANFYKYKLITYLIELIKEIFNDMNAIIKKKNTNLQPNQINNYDTYFRKHGDENGYNSLRESIVKLDDIMDMDNINNKPYSKLKDEFIKILETNNNNGKYIINSVITTDNLQQYSSESNYFKSININLQSDLEKDEAVLFIKKIFKIDNFTADPGCTNLVQKSTVKSDTSLYYNGFAKYFNMDAYFPTPVQKIFSKGSMIIQGIVTNTSNSNSTKYILGIQIFNRKWNSKNGDDVVNDPFNELYNQVKVLTNKSKCDNVTNYLNAYYNNFRENFMIVGYLVDGKMYSIFEPYFDKYPNDPVTTKLKNDFLLTGNLIKDLDTAKKSQKIKDYINGKYRGPNVSRKTRNSFIVSEFIKTMAKYSKDTERVSLYVTPIKVDNEDSKISFNIFKMDGGSSKEPLISDSVSMTNELRDESIKRIEDKLKSQDKNHSEVLAKIEDIRIKPVDEENQEKIKSELNLINAEISPNEKDNGVVGKEEVENNQVDSERKEERDVSEANRQTGRAADGAAAKESSEAGQPTADRPTAGQPPAEESAAILQESLSEKNKQELKNLLPDLNKIQENIDLLDLGQQSKEFFNGLMKIITDAAKEIKSDETNKLPSGGGSLTSKKQKTKTKKSNKKGGKKTKKR